MLQTKGYIIEYEKDDRIKLVIVVASSSEQALEIACREKETDIATVIDDSEIIFAD